MKTKPHDARDVMISGLYDPRIKDPSCIHIESGSQYVTTPNGEGSSEALLIVR